MSRSVKGTIGTYVGILHHREGGNLKHLYLRRPRQSVRKTFLYPARIRYYTRNFEANQYLFYPNVLLDQMGARPHSTQCHPRWFLLHALIEHWEFRALR
jgi:hypothetical protein